MIGLAELFVVLLKIVIFMIMLSLLLIVAGGFAGFKGVLLIVGGFMLAMGVLILARSLGYLPYSVTGLACLVTGLLYLIVSFLIGFWRPEARFIFTASVSLLLYFVGEVLSYYGVLGLGGFTLAVSSFFVLAGFQIVMEAYRR